MKKTTSNDKKVKDYIRAIEECIVRDYGMVPAEWQPQIDQLENYYRIYLQASDQLSKESLIITTASAERKNPLLTIMNDAINYMDRIIKKFGLSPYDRKYIKPEHVAPTSEDEAYLDAL